METIFQFVLLPIFTTAVIAFFSSAFVRPKIFMQLLRPVMFLTAACMLSVTAFLLGVTISGIRVLKYIPIKDSIANSNAWDAINTLTYPCAYVICLCFLFMIVTVACMYSAQRQLREDEQKLRSLDSGNT